MKQSKPCCQDPGSLVNSISPFTKIIALGFYDGPTSGILQCQTCQAVYKFEMLDWDENHNIRLFRLAALPPNSLEECVAALAGPQSPRWPVWVPAPSNYPDEETARKADQSVQQILAKAQPADLVIAWEGYGEKILSAKKLPAANVAHVPDWFSLDHPDGVQPWFSMLGLTKVNNH